MDYIDLHVHSNHSDGTFTPSQLVETAAQVPLKAFALTDHDSFSGVKEAITLAKQYKIEVISGVEFSTDYKGIDIHMLGLDLDPDSSELSTYLQDLHVERDRRNQRMIDKMAADGIDISMEKMKECFGDAVLTRASFARYLNDHGYTQNYKDAFISYIGDDCKYFEQKIRVDCFKVVRLIRHLGGIPVLAHPFQYHLDDADLREFISRLKEGGLLGMEVYYSIYTPKQMEYLLQLCHEYDLAPSGGSDFHGANKPTIKLGRGEDNLQIPYSLLENLRSRNK